MNNTKTIRTLIVHVVFWLLNYWLITQVLSHDWNNSAAKSKSFSYAYAYGLFYNATSFYMQVFWLVPKMYVLNKKLRFYVFSFFTVIVISLIETYFDKILDGIYHPETEQSFLNSFINTTIFHILYSISGFFFIIILEYKKSEKVKQSLLEESYKTELKYLRAQLNPHFLFNGINSVYHLIGKNNELAKDTLLQFSELLRYQLYESGTSITLEKELGYISQYINIEEIRRGSDIQLNYEIEFENSTKKITPLLLIPFIENAFKHCSHYIDGSKNLVDIKIIEVENLLTLHIRNSFDNLITPNPTGGIGLNNVKRRLSLLYPNRYELNMKKENNYFIIDLTINL